MTDQKKESYFNLSKAFNELRHESVGAKEVTVSSLQLLGKGLFNAAKFTATEVLPVMVEAAATYGQHTSKQALKRADLSDEQRAKLEEIHSKTSEHVEAKREARRARRENEESERSNAAAVREPEQARSQQDETQQANATRESAELPSRDAREAGAVSISEETPLLATDKPQMRSAFSRAAAIAGGGSSNP